MSICIAQFRWQPLTRCMLRYTNVSRETVVDVSDDGREQETELSLTNRARHLCKNNGVTELVKTRPSPYVLPCRILSFCVKGCRHKYSSSEYRGTPKIGKRWNSALLGWEEWLTTIYTSIPHLCYHVKFGSSATKGVCSESKVACKNRSESQNWERWGPAPLR